MKFKTTKKAIKEGYDKIVSCGYCNAQNLLKYSTPIAYSTRAEGWACDYFEINGVLISTGYAPLAPKNTKSNYNIIHEYDQRAYNIIKDTSLNYKEQESQINMLLKDFINAVS
jgi:hypothetical protein